ncbi:hypothetical protein [Clostridium sp. AWRP]|uniref:hypothetical protein n=1 Tax=Clostridium sp. AWRP TaxID=2212991 RepID=UPI001FAAF770|nr:hypothetical protein [Clostridium sp. AWRP]
MFEIYFSTLDRSEVYKLPVLPENMPELAKTAKNEEFESYDNGFYNILGNVSLITFPLEGFLPEYPGKYPWAQSQINPYLLINLWSQAMISKKPIRCIMNRGINKNNISPEILNWMVSVESLSQHPRRNKDILYKVEFKEYRCPIKIDITPAKNALNSAISSAINGIRGILK